jgi:hypothetical protein
MSEHSPILGGSNASRLLNCPASYSEIQRSPVSDTTSGYADLGSAKHALAAKCMTEVKQPVNFEGETFLGYPGKDLVDDVAKGFDMLRDLLDSTGGGKYKVIGVETTLAMPGIAGAFGSVDLVLANKEFVVVVDWKYGSGVIVRATYPIPDDPDSETLNPQPVYYTISARSHWPKIFNKKRRIIMAIVQPAIDDGLSYTEVTHEELDEYHQRFKQSVTEALGRNPHREKGDWCRWAPCKSTCKLWTGKVFDLAVLDPQAAAMKESTRPANGATSFGTYISAALDVAEQAELWIAEIRRQAHLLMESGAAVPNWRLVPKRANRTWKADADVLGTLNALGIPGGEMYEAPKLKSVAQMEKTCKSRSVTLPEALYESVSSGTNIAPAEDPRPSVDRKAVTERLAIALKAL